LGASWDDLGPYWEPLFLAKEASFWQDGIRRAFFWGARRLLVPICFCRNMGFERSLCGRGVVLRALCSLCVQKRSLSRNHCKTPATSISGPIMGGLGVVLGQLFGDLGAVLGDRGAALCAHYFGMGAFFLARRHPAVFFGGQDGISCCLGRCWGDLGPS